MSRLDDHGDHGGQDDVDATFEQIVAGLRAQGVGGDGGVADLVERPERPERRERSGDTGGRTDAGERDTLPERTEPSTPPAANWRTGGAEWDSTVLGGDPADDDEHYVPPEPPPLPRPRKGAFVVLLFFVVGLLLLIAPGVIGLSSSVGLPLGMLALASGITLLLLRVKQGPPDGADPDSGAQV
ncbi:hypothetical protein CFN78_05335 [Amycolatopsis antarctica]|uniref:DUF308 domain-containing protein n=1 Tax=Amycolatopsis antarctica TaxID=1854586 RepID=A0A263DAL3_9PSEU|nr:hypothetical protein [Amycolatopsis antarctica]OZM74536.1 hypothetical protein CFN78_05335 [Amycolatopsis antarctica]